MQNLCRAVQRAQLMQGAFSSAPHPLLSLIGSPCSSSSSSSNAKQLSSSSSDGVTATAERNSKAQHEDPEQQQHQAAPAAFSTSPDAFTAHLQSKTEADVFSLLENARAARLAEAAAAAKAAASGDAGAAADAAAQAEEDAADDDTADMINPETGEVYGPRGKEPTRYGDWEIKGRATDFS